MITDDALLDALAVALDPAPVEPSPAELAAFHQALHDALTPDQPAPTSLRLHLRRPLTALAAALVLGTGASAATAVSGGKLPAPVRDLAHAVGLSGDDSRPGHPADPLAPPHPEPPVTPPPALVPAPPPPVPQQPRPTGDDHHEGSVAPPSSGGGGGPGPSGGETSVTTLTRRHELILSVGTTAAVVALVLPLLLPVSRTGRRL